jgi:transposase InsO family protein
VEGVLVEPTAEFAQLRLGFVDQTQWRYEVIRPLVLFADRTASQRAQETETHPDTVRTLQRRFRQQGMAGLLLADVEVVPRRRASPIPDAVRQEIDRLKALYDGFHYRELARILFIKFGHPIDHNTVETIWQASAVSTQGQLALMDYHAQPDRYHARLQVIRLYYQGWAKVSIMRVLQVSRPPVNAWIRRFEAEHFAGLVDKPRGPKHPHKVWLPLIVQVYHVQKAHPDAGEFRIWSLLAQPDISVRTVGRIMALNRLVYDDIPHGPKRGIKPRAGPHRYKATFRHQYWFIDSRRMDFALDGVHWWSLVILEGYSRTILAGMIAPTEATWVALMVLYTACLGYGAPVHLVSDSGGAYTSADFEAVCTRLQIQHETIVSTKGESYLNWMETHFNIQRRLYAYQFSLTQTPAELEQRHQAFIHTYNTTAHQGLLKDRRVPPKSPWQSWERRRAASTPKTSWPTRSHKACSHGQRIDMAVSPCTATTSTWKLVYPRQKCCCGYLASTCGRPLRTWSWQNIMAAMTGGITRSKTSTAACSTRRACLAARDPDPLNAAGILGGISTEISQVSDPSSRDHATAAALRDRAHRVRSASFPTGGKVIMTRFGTLEVPDAHGGFAPGPLTAHRDDDL